MAKKVLIAARIQAEHHDAQAFNKDLEQLCERRAAIVAKLKSEAEFLYKAMEKQYCFEVKDATNEPYLPDHVRLDAIRVLRKWKNKQVFDDVTRVYGVACGDDIPEVVCSVVYFRMNDLLLHVPGTGRHVLKPSQRCDHEEWNLLKKGIVPLKFAA